MVNLNQSSFTSKLWTILAALLDALFPESHNERRLESLSSGDLTRACRPAEPVGAKDCLAALSYREPLVRQLIWNLKYRGNHRAARLCAEILHEHIVSEMADTAAFINFGRPLLIGMPLAKARQKQRGFNQSLLIAEQIAAIDHRRILDRANGHILTKIKETEPQTAMATRRERLNNLRGVFKVAEPKAVRGRTIILIDDVITTGATMREARKTLMSAGARRVLCFAVAH